MIVVFATIAKYDVWRILVDSGSSIDILFYDAFSKMNIATDRLRPVSTVLTSFTGDSVGIEGDIILLVTVGTSPR